MTQNPYTNAVLAYAYIVAIVTIIVLTGRLEETAAGGNYLAPVVMLSLLVLSVAVMAYLFFYRPLILILDGRREEGAAFFLKSIATLAILTVIFGVAALVLFYR